MRRLLVALLLAAGAAVSLVAQSYVPERVYDTDRGRFADFESMLADLVTSDVVFVGEQHDDPNTHRLELAILEGLARRRGDLVVALEMFERDVQEPLDHFTMGHMDEAEFLKASRPWPRYATDYKPLVDFAIKREWPVVAANVPRALASAVSKAGLDALKGRPDAERAWVAAELKCDPDGDYFDKFRATMSAHPMPGDEKRTDAEKRTNMERFYASQCLKDETMAESVAGAWQVGATGGKRPLVVHYNGAFHSDFHLGAAERTERRLPKQRVAVVTVLPVASLDTLAPTKDDRKRADYLVYTLRTK